MTGYSKRSLEDHFDKPHEELVQNLRMGGEKKAPLLEQVEAISNLANFAYVRQKGPYGNGTPLLNAEHLIGDEPFIFTWSDDFIKASPLRFQQMIDVYEEFGCPVLSTITAENDAEYDRYGFAGGEPIRDGLLNVRQIIEKPGKAAAPSNQATVSGFLLTPEVFDYVHQAAETLHEGKELYSNDALKLMLQDGKQIVACQIKNGTYYDAGDKLEYIKTVIDFALEHEDIGPALKEYLKTKA